MMSHFTGLEGTVKSGVTWTGWPQQCDFAEFITGQVEAEKEGKYKVEQCFNLPSPMALNASQVTYSVEEWAEKGKWDIVTEETVKAGETKPFQIFGLAPYWRVTFKTTAAEDNKVRIFARAFERGRV